MRYEALAHNFASWVKTATVVEIELIVGLLGAELALRGEVGSQECFNAQREIAHARSQREHDPENNG